MSRAIVNMDTGEITHLENGDKIRIIRKSSIDYFRDKHKELEKNEIKLDCLGYEKFLPNDPFVKVFTNELFAISSEISKSAFYLFMRLCNYTAMGSNILVSRNNKMKLTFKYICDNISGVSTRQTRTIIKELQDKLLIISCSDCNGNNQYVVNPYLYFRGALINKTIKGLFSSYERRTST